ncbi:MAG: hypothetical protein ACYDDU_21710 [Dermatophilaceae bacterium]
MTEPVIRAQLREALGLCSRHVWGYAVVEIELWVSGGGSRGGHQPFEVSLLCEDLLADVIRRLTRHRRWRRSVIAGGEGPSLTSCRSALPVGLCDAVKPSPVETSMPPTGYAGADTAVLTLEANANP